MDHWGSEIYGTDKAGHHIWVEKVTGIDATSLLDRFDDNAMMNTRAIMMEALEIHKGNAINPICNKVYKHIYVMDLSGLKFGHFSGGVRRVVQNVIVEMGNLYPESVCKMFFVNAPLAFRAIWGLVCPWLHQVTKDKTKIIGGKSAILAEFAAAGVELKDIPECWGGQHKGVPIKTMIEGWREDKKNGNDSMHKMCGYQGTEEKELSSQLEVTKISVPAEEAAVAA